MFLFRSFLPFSSPERIPWVLRGDQLNLAGSHSAAVAMKSEEESPKEGGGGGGEMPG